MNNVLSYIWWGVDLLYPFSDYFLIFRMCFLKIRILGWIYLEGSGEPLKVLNRRMMWYSVVVVRNETKLWRNQQFRFKSVDEW